MNLTLDNFETLHKTQDFLNLPASIVIEILKSDDLLISSEECVFNSVKLWVNHDDANRKIELAQLMRSFLVDEVLKFCLLCAECFTSISQAIKDKDNKSSIYRETPRRKKEKIALVGEKDLNVSFISQVEYIDLKSGQKHPLKPLNQARSDFSAATLRRDSSTDVYAIGGRSSKSVERWNSKTGDWEITAPLLMAVWYHSKKYL
ncbi:kelch-like protein 25 [Arctopsyche grandis]|uniref:kelch-like protein 25 n=1 Tax=Arctopsyche grandis TaxID=121162 RepID=UPI00406D7C2B